MSLSISFKNTLNVPNRGGGWKDQRVNNFVAEGRRDCSLEFRTRMLIREGGLTEWKDYNSVYSFLACGFLKSFTFVDLVCSLSACTERPKQDFNN